ncbi:MAG: POTRA domain-containing protein [Bacteroidota bacterium]
MSFLKYVASILALLTVSSPLISQPADSISTIAYPFGVIDTIIIAGNQKTKSYVILDEMTLHPGDTATWEAMEFDKNRIYSLQLFNRVEMFYDSLQGLRFLYVEVHERWYLIPVPLFGFRDGDPKRPYYGGGLLHNNFAGKNQRLFGSIVFGHNPSLNLSFSDPLLDRPMNLYFSGSASYSRIRNKSKAASAVTGDFDELHYDVNATIGRRFSLYETAGINIGYQIVKIDEYRPGRTISPGGKDNYIYAQVNYSYDTRDLREYPSRGNSFSVYARKYGLGTSKLDFARFGTDIRTYRPLPFDLTFAARVHGVLTSGGATPTYQHLFFGYGERIRGYFKTVFEGENMLGSVVELRYPLLKPRMIHFTALPIPAEFAVWRFGISLAIFAETGTTWFRGQKVQLESFHSGYGGGLDFLLPYSVVIRTHYAFSDYGDGQFVLDLRGAF